jgi:serine/threonine protein kinase
MQCPHCSQANPASALRCANCGAPLSRALPAGKLLHGRYHLLQPLTTGGMGALYLATETIANNPRKVVIKEMLDYYDPGDPQNKVKAQERFASEAATLASLSIHGIPQVFDYFSEAGRNYIVMQYIEGQNLEQGLTRLDDSGAVIRGRPYPSQQVRSWGVKICKMLENLAAYNVIHLDIKPANLIVDKAGEVWLVDFGTAKAPRFTPPGGKARMGKSSVYGTLGYAPLEQVSGHPEPRSDVYALAASLYHLMTDDDPAVQPGVFPKLVRLSKNTAQALRLALQPDVHKRITAAEFGRLLERRQGQGPAFFWRDGTVAYEPGHLSAAADRLWQEALEYFQGDAWTRWLRELHRNDLAAKLQAVKANQTDPQLALDAFLRLLDPAFASPRLELSLPTLNAGVMPWGSRKELSFRVINRGGGCLHGQILSQTPGLQAEPAGFASHDSCLVKLTLDASPLTPSARQQTLSVEVDAGTGGRATLPVKVMVPEPQLKLEVPTPDLGRCYRGEQVQAILRVRNPGGSKFIGHAHTDCPWLQVEPGDFECAPYSTQILNLSAHTEGLSLGGHAATLHIESQAQGWGQAAKAPIQVLISPWKTFIRYGLPPLGWLAGWCAYGGITGSLLGGWSASLFGGIGNWRSAGVLGALFGAAIFALIGGLIGGFSQLEIGGPVSPARARPGPPVRMGLRAGLRLPAWESWKAGAQRGALYGLLGGSLSGFLLGGLSFSFLIRLGFDLGTRFGFQAFGALAGGLSALALGGLLWLAPHQ